MASILDRVPVDDKAFPLDQPRCCSNTPNKTPLEVTSSCPRCGSPIYSRVKLNENDIPEVKFSCSCHQQNTMDSSMITK